MSIQFSLFHITYILRKNEFLLDHFMTVEKPLKREKHNNLRVFSILLYTMNIETFDKNRLYVNEYDVILVFFV